jgi:hypothetical protein
MFTWRDRDPGCGMRDPGSGIRDAGCGMRSEISRPLKK